MTYPGGGGPAPLAGEDFWPITYTRYSWNDEATPTFAETITYYDTTSRLATRVTLQNTSTLHTGLCTVWDNKGRVVATINPITAPYALNTWDLTGLRINVDTDNYTINLAMKG